MDARAGEQHPIRRAGARSTYTRSLVKTVPYSSPLFITPRRLLPLLELWQLSKSPEPLERGAQESTSARELVVDALAFLTLAHGDCFPGLPAGGKGSVGPPARR